MSVPMESRYATSYLWLIVTDNLSRTATELSQLIGQILDTLRFWAPLGDLGATYDDHLRLIGKRVVDFLLVLIELFNARCYCWGATSDFLFEIGDYAPPEAGWPKISGRTGRSHQPFFFSEN